MKSESASASPKARAATSRFWRRFTQYAMLVIVLGAPLLFGGGPTWVQATLSSAAMLVALAWVISRNGEVVGVPFAGVAALAVLVTLVQLVPLPAGLVGLLSPRALELRSEAAGTAVAFLPLTLDVPGTLLAALKGMACLAILLVGASATHSRGRSGTFALALVFVGGAVALLSIVQRTLGIGEIYGFYKVADMPGSGVFGSFVSGNHAASLFTLGGLLAIGCARETEGTLKGAVGVAGLLCAVGLVSTGSRGGVMGAAAALLVMAILWLAQRFGRNVAVGAGAGLLVVGLPSALLLALGLRGQVHGGTVDAILSGQKVRGWLDGLALTAEFPWTGVGRGAFEAPATAYRVNPESMRLVFPENILVQLMSEWGIPIALALIALFVATAVTVARRISRWEPVFQAAACAVLAIVVHELADFGLEVPGVAFPTALVLGLVAGRLQVSRSAAPSEQPARLRWPIAAPAMAVGLALAAASPWATRHTLEADGERAAALTAAAAPTAAADARASIARHPADYYSEMIAAEGERPTRSPAGLKHLNRAQRLFPGSHAPHLEAGRYLMSLGRASQAALEYRLAAERGAVMDNYDLLARVGFKNLENAVPRRPDALHEARALPGGSPRVQEADAATARAVELAGGDEASRMERLQVALSTRDRAFTQPGRHRA